VGVCRDTHGEWAMVTLCAEPGGFERTEVAQEARTDARGLGVVAGGAPPLLRATPDSLDVVLGGARLHARFRTRRDWPRRAFGGLGPAQVVPFLGQYWTPHLLSAGVRGEAVLGDRAIALDGARVYAEKNWGTAFAAHWWWGQASLDGGAGVAFAGGRVHGVAPTAVAAWTPDGLVALAPPFARTVARASGGEWHIRARSPHHAIEVRGEATGPPLRLPVPIPAERRLELRSEHHLAGRLEVSVRRGRRTVLRGESAQAGLEDGRP
jgi:tocopherol cyclase